MPQTSDNVHATAVPPPLNWGQPDAFTCNDTTEPDAVDCEILVTAHPEGGSKTTVGEHAISFQ